MPKPKKLKIRPYARLLTMLGEQLIKNERIALIELIKNAYDADSPWVKISFIGFENNFSFNSESKIIIEDSGSGMDADIIEKHWLNPATPEKLRRKEKKNTTPSGRIIQGEKGIGRFAILKLGRTIKVTTRAKGEDVEYIVDYDFSKYDDDFLSEEGKDKNLFIDDLSVSLHARKPKIIRDCSFPLGVRKIKRLPHGTRIEISDLKGSWTEIKIESLYRDIARLESIFSHRIEKANKAPKKSFEVRIDKDDKQLHYQEKYIENLNIRPACDTTSREDRNIMLYVLVGSKLSPKQEKTVYSVKFGGFKEQHNQAIVLSIKGKIYDIRFKKLELKEWNVLKGKRIGRLLPPYITSIQQRYALYLQRQGLPRTPEKAVIGD